MSLQSQDAPDRNIVRGAEVGLSIALKEVLESSTGPEGEFACLQGRVTTLESTIPIREGGRTEPREI